LCQRCGAAEPLSAEARERTVVPMWARAARRRAAGRIRAVEGYEFRGDVVARFRAAHPEVDDDLALSQVTAGARTWFRLLAADPAATLGPPSKAVCDLWLEMARDEESYAGFCGAAFGAVLPFTPLPVPLGGRLTGARDLLRTLELARKDESGVDGALPGLFRLDEAVGIAGGRRYVAECGGGAVCHPVPGRWCLRHLVGEGAPERRTYDPRRDKPASRSAGGMDHGHG
jgi:hypothetical protein